MLLNDCKMNLKEPKKKKKVKLKPQPPFPIVLGDGSEWITYTAHLTELGSYIIDPNEISAVNSMGFFGKGSLSRSFPAFGRARYGAPPVVRNRQWTRRQEWLKQVRELSRESDFGKHINSDDDRCEQSNKLDCENLNDTAKEKDSAPDIIEVHTSLPSSKEKDTNVVTVENEMEIDQVILDSIEEDDVCEIISKDIVKQCNEDHKSDNEKESKHEEKEEHNNCDNYYFKEENSYFINNDLDIQDKLLVLPDSDSETENYLKEIVPRIESASFPIQETLHLSFEETFFLMYGLGCLNLVNFDGSLLNINSAWHYFCKTDKHFVQKYVVYHYFRSKRWVVKPGLKYGGDFLIYKQGPPFYHASYIVIVDVVDADSLIRDPRKSMRNFTWNNLIGLERLSETAAKEVLFAQVLWPCSVSRIFTPSTPDVLSDFSVRELLWRRWNPKNNNTNSSNLTKDIIDLLEEEDDDSC